MEEKTYKVQEIFDWFKKFNKNEILIKSKNKEFNIEITNKILPHLLGLQYINNKNDKFSELKGRRLYNYVEFNKLSDEDIYKLVSLNNEDKLNDIANRINTFKEFMENLEKGYILEQTNPYTQIKSNYLIIQTKENLFLHLGIKTEVDGEKIVDFKVDDKTREILETYFIRNDTKYFKNSKIFEKVEKIEKYDEKAKKYIPFSFDEEKNKILKEAYKNNKELSYKEALNNFMNKEIDKSLKEENTNNSWNNWNKNKSNDFER